MVVALQLDTDFLTHCSCFNSYNIDRSERVFRKESFAHGIPFHIIALPFMPPSLNEVGTTVALFEDSLCDRA